MKNLKIVSQKDLKDWAKELFSKNSYKMIDVSPKQQTFRRALACGKIIVGKETITLHFDQNLNLMEQKQKITTRVEDLNKKIFIANSKLKNKSFIKKAPKQIIEKEKTALKDNKIQLKKLNSILNSIKN